MLHAEEGGEDTPYFLVIGAVFKNEAHAIREWTEHYLVEGADHVLLIDNGSTDDYHTHIEDLISSGQVTVFRDPQQHYQRGLYQRHFTAFLPKTQWMAIVDLDEFMYGRNGSIAAYMRTVSPDVGRVEVPWKMFGSSGHKVQPDGGIVENFVQRRPWYIHRKNLKSIVRASIVTDFDQHQTRIADGYHFVYPLLPGVDTGEAEKQTEETRTLFAIHLNHYPIQSFQWFMEVKGRRGDVAAAESDGLRGEKYFRDYDHNEVFDDELRSKHRAALQHRGERLLRESRR